MFWLSYFLVLHNIGTKTKASYIMLCHHPVTWGTHLVQTWTVVYTHPQWNAAHWQRVNQGLLPSYTLVPLNELRDIYTDDLCQWEALLYSLIVVTPLLNASVGAPFGNMLLGHHITLLYTSLRCHWIWVVNTLLADKVSQFPTLPRESIFPSASPSWTAVVELLLCMCLELRRTVNTRTVCYTHVEYLQLQHILCQE